MEIKDKELHRIVVTAIIYKPTTSAGRSDFSYLIIKRSLHKEVMPGKWTVPGGGLEVDDYINTAPSTEGAKQWYHALEKTLRREIKEEVNLEIGEPEFLIDYTFIRPDGVPVLGLTYLVSYISGEVDLDEDSTEFVWAAIDKLDNYDLIDGIADEIRKADKILKNR